MRGGISEKTGIPNYFLCRWRNSIENDLTFVPRNKIGHHKRLMTQEEESLIAEFFPDHYLNPAVMVRRNQFQTIILDLWIQMDIEEQQFANNKRISYHFLINFCKRNDFSF